MNTNIDNNVTENKTVVTFTDWEHNKVEMTVESRDPYTNHVYGEYGGINVKASVNDHWDDMIVEVVLKDETYKGVKVVSEVHIEKSMFAYKYSKEYKEVLTSVVQKAVEKVLTYASLWNNNDGIIAEKLNAALRNFGNTFALEVKDYLQDGVAVDFFQANATIVAG